MTSGKRQETSGLKLVSEIASIWREFADDTTLHGCKKVNTRKYKILRLLWFSLIVAMFGTWVSLVTDLYNKYFSYPYITKNKISQHNYLPFPAVTLCLLSPYDNSKLSAYKDFGDYIMGHDSLSKYLDINVTEPSKVPDITKTSKLGNVFEPEDIVIEGSIKRNSINISSDFQMSYSPQKVCFTYNGQKTKRDGELLVNAADWFLLLLNIKQQEYHAFADSAGVEVFIHDPREAPPLHGQSVLAEPGTLTTLMLSTTQYEVLPAPYSSFGGETCRDDTKTEENGGYYSWVNCVHECIQATVLKKCDCTIQTDADNASNACTFIKKIECAHPTMDEAYTTTLSGNDSECECPRPCKFTQYNIRSSSAAYPPQILVNYLLRKGAIHNADDVRSNFLKLKIQYGNMIVDHVIHEPEVTFRSILSTLGGYMGFFLGASLLTVVELFQTILNTGWATVAWMKSPSQTKSRVEAFKK